MANFLKKVINKQSSIRLISSLSLTHQKTPFFNLTPHLFLNKDKNGTTLNPNFSYDDLDQKGGNVVGVGVGSHMVYPSFSLGLFLNPGLGNGVELGLGSVGGNVNVGDEAERSGVVWADSVKKKRKKKMNKHKYKKLRKRLRKKTKKT